ALRSASLARAVPASSPWFRYQRSGLQVRSPWGSSLLASAEPRRACSLHRDDVRLRAAIRARVVAGTLYGKCRATPGTDRAPAPANLCVGEKGADWGG